jgi:CTP:molybdopterin cytidylyltransferase MocA
MISIPNMEIHPQRASHDVEPGRLGQAEEVKPSSPKTIALILAAGSGSRFEAGGHKLHAILGGQALYLWAIQAAVEANIGSVIVVVGAVELPTADLAVSVVTNPAWQTGMASSLQVGIASASEQGAEAVVVGLGDQPFVRASAWRAVADSRSPIAVATYQGKRGNPVRLHAEMWSTLPTLGDEGARSVFQMYSNLVEEVPCEGSSRDIDTLEDLNRMDIELGENH